MSCSKIPTASDSCVCSKSIRALVQTGCDAPSLARQRSVVRRRRPSGRSQTRGRNAGHATIGNDVIGVGVEAGGTGLGEPV
jgi:hypothetical protein